MMCVKVCLHMFLLQINQINEIKHSESVCWNKKKYKKHDLCVISIENQFLVSFSLNPALYYATLRHNPRSDFLKNGLKLSARLEGKSHEVSAWKNNNRLRYNKKCRGGADSAPLPGSFRVNIPECLVEMLQLCLLLRFMQVFQYCLIMILLWWHHSSLYMVKPHRRAHNLVICNYMF